MNAYCRSCLGETAVSCHWCGHGLCAEHAAAHPEFCPNCFFEWVEEIDQPAALRAVQERTADTGGPPGDGSTSRLSWALRVAVRLGCSSEQIREAEARGRVMRERRRVRRLLAGAR